MLEKLNWFYLTSLIALLLLIWKWSGLFLRKDHLLKSWDCLFLLSWIRALILSLLLKLLPRKLEPWFFRWSFLILRLLCIFINLLCGFAWNTVFMSGLVYLGVTWKLSYKNGYVELFALRLVPLLNPWLMAVMQPADIFSIGILVSTWYLSSELVPLPCTWRRSTRCSERFHNFSDSIPWCYQVVYLSSFFPCTARLWNFLPIECFSLTCYLSGFKFRTNRHLLSFS